jgi:hypothetical protein
MLTDKQATGRHLVNLDEIVSKCDGVVYFTDTHFAWVMRTHIAALRRPIALRLQRRDPA